MHVSIKPTMQRCKICFGSSSSPFASHVDLQSVCLIFNYKTSRTAQGAKVELDMGISIITYLRLFLVNHHPYSPRDLQYICLILYYESILGEIGSRSQS